ncbi:MAG: hypothetical protein IPP79_20780 [Chitinophagaceae bacterium]|nr:hypothetical protein [Chitinophagaceae bacterium]
MPSIFHSTPMPASTNWSWTITSRFANMLHKAETKYGQRIQTHTFVGIECAPVVTPHLFILAVIQKKSLSGSLKTV